MLRDFSYNERGSSGSRLNARQRAEAEWSEGRKKEMEDMHGKGYEEKIDQKLEDLKNARLPTKNKTFNSGYGVAVSMGLEDLEKAIHGSTEDQFIELVKSIVHEELQKMRPIQPEQQLEV